LVSEAQPRERDRRRTFRARQARVALRRFGRFLSTHVFTNLTRRILVLNVFASIALVSGILYLNQFREGLIDARLQSLLTQGEIIAGAIASSATVETDSIYIDPERLLELQTGESASPLDDDANVLDFPINPERVAPILRRLISPTSTRARIYDRDGTLLLDSRFLYSRGQVLRFDLPPVNEPPGFIGEAWNGLMVWLRRSDLPVYEELGAANGRGYPEVSRALDGSAASIVRVNERGEMVVSVAVPVQRFRGVVGVLLLSTQGGEIDAIVTAERLGILRVALVVVVVTALLSILLAGTIARPLGKLAAAADRVRRGVKIRTDLPELTDRPDEIGNLARSFRDMTDALHLRMDAIESFAADVSHELKNPLTSLRSAVETLPLAKTDESRNRLLAVIQHDVKRLNRLISDISDASRLDAELAREDAEPVDVVRLILGVIPIAREIGGVDGPKIAVDIKPNEKASLFALGHDGRLGQVINNLVDNARSFSPVGGTITVTASRVGDEIVVTVDDEGPGIRPDALERIFERFYTDRPDAESFGNNSGLGLSISRQIVEAHRGRLEADNRMGKDGKVLGARFTIRLPAEGG
jgi:two-component system sensor histidine kinase ChvG